MACIDTTTVECDYSFVVLRSGTRQLFSQGMADLLLDACSDYWDGHEVRPLGEEERFVLLLMWLMFVVHQLPFCVVI